MTLKSSSAQRNQTRRVQPALEGLEDRKLLSRAAMLLAILVVAAAGQRADLNRWLSAVIDQLLAFVSAIAWLRCAEGD